MPWSLLTLALDGFLMSCIPVVCEDEFCRVGLGVAETLHEWLGLCVQATQAHTLTRKDNGYSSFQPSTPAHCSYAS